MNAIEHVAQLEGALADLLAYACRGVVQVRTGRGFGTGILWCANADAVEIVTNAHVIGRDVRQRIQVVTHDQQVCVARVVRFQPAFDLALLRLESADAVDVQNLLALPFARDASARVGELVFAIGNPRGGRNVITMGTLSGWASAVASGQRIRVLRSDVLLAPGNSGGPLLNARGSVIGVNALIVGGDQSVSIPAPLVRSVLDLREPRAMPTMRAA